MITRLTEFAIRAPKTVLALAALAFVLFGVIGSSASERLSAGGYLDPAAESAQAGEILAADFGLSSMQLIFAIESASGAMESRATVVAGEIIDDLKADPRVESVVAPWSDAQITAQLLSRDGRIGLVVATLSGNDNEVQHTAEEIAARHVRDIDGVTVTAGGQAMALFEISAQAQRDILLAEAIVVPLTFLLLVWFLRSAVAAAIPVVVGIFAIVGTTAVLFLLTLITELSVFALNVATALGLALAIDYSLLIIGRYREEVGRGRDQTTAIAIAMRNGGRAILYSGITVTIALLGMSLFPMMLLKSIGFAGAAVVALSIVLAITCVPALLAVFGSRINRKPLQESTAAESTPLYRVAVAVQRRPALFALPVLAVLLLAGAPIAGLQIGLSDDRVLPESAEAHRVGDLLRERFDQNATGTVHIVLSGPGANDNSSIGSYATALSLVPDVRAVVSSAGVFAGGQSVGPGDPRAATHYTAHLTVMTPLDPYSPEARKQLETLRNVDAPADSLFGGLAQQTDDAATGIVSGFPKTLAWIAITTFVLLFLLTGSVLLPLKALALNVLSLAATFGATVWIFQDGHLGGLGTTTTGYTGPSVPVLVFCIAFGLSMDYEVFLLTRFTEEWRNSGRTRADSDAAVAIGLARSGRVVTAAAALMALVFAGIATSGVSLMRMLGFGLILAVLVDATLIRMILVPALMRVAGTWNWWAPRRSRSIVEKVRVRAEAGS
ncbi:MMPL family transporter [Nocardia lijiangensis]|uniref:MMPL family transporter n=1 Tax=Nocardia lijiangensis TaxID=299618 RepID=UPI00082F8E5E|nr:MMPL family transporter [Nocardia lijiangensis]